MISSIEKTIVERIKDVVKSSTGKEASHLIRSIKDNEGILIGDTYVFLQSTKYVTVRIITPKENKIFVVDKNGKIKDNNVPT